MLHSIINRREFGVQSVVTGAIFIATLAVAILVDLAGLLQYSGLISGLPATILETGAAISAISIFPLLAMGMFISSDLNRKK
jgi:hypothetical protein